MSWRPTALGVDVQGRTVFLALVERKGREAVVRRLVEVALPDTTTDDSHRVIGAVVARAVRDEALAADRIVLGLPAGSTIVRRLEVPVVGARKVKQALAFAIEPLIPYTAEDVFADGIVIGHTGTATELLAFALRRDDVVPLVTAMTQAGARPEIATPDLVSVLDALPPVAGGADAREVVFYTRGARGFFAVREGARVVDFRPLRGAADDPGLRRDARRSLMALLNDGAPVERVVLAGDAHALVDLTAGLSVLVETVELELPATIPDAVQAGVGDPTPWDVAVCLAAQGLQRSPHALNFCQADLSTDQVAAWLGPLRRTAVMTGVTLLVYTGSLLTQRVALRSQRDQLRRGIQNQFAAVLPGVTSIEAAQARVEETRETHKDLAPFVRPGPTVIEVLAACDAAMRDVPKVRIESLTISGDVLRLTGEVADFRAVTILETALAASPLLADVQTTRAGEGRREGSTGFRLNARVNRRGSLDDVRLPPPRAAGTRPAPQPAAPAGGSTAAPAMPAEATTPEPVATEAREIPQTPAVAGPVPGEQTLFAPGSQPTGTRSRLDKLFAGESDEDRDPARVPWPGARPGGGRNDS